MNDNRLDNISFLIEGPAACFRRPEFVEDFVSYDVVTPLAARRAIRANYGEELAVEIQTITVLNAIEQCRTELDGRQIIKLRDVAYRIDASLSISSDKYARVLETVDFQPRETFLGLRSLPGAIRRLRDDEAMAVSALADDAPLDLGWMLFDVVKRGRARARFFRPIMIAGKIDVVRAAALGSLG